VPQRRPRTTEVADYCTEAAVPRFTHVVLVASASWTFNSEGGKSGGRRRSTGRGIAALSVAGRCIRLTAPNTYAVSRISMSTRHEVDQCRRKQERDAGTSDSGKYVDNASVSDWTNQFVILLLTLGALAQVKKYPFTSTWAPSAVFTALITADSKSNDGRLTMLSMTECSRRSIQCLRLPQCTTAIQ